MANFGFSLGDIILVSNIAYTVYKSSKHAGKDFKVITADVKSLRSHLRALDDEFANPKSLVHRAGADQKEELETLLTYCRDDLKDLKDLLFKYRSLKSKSPRARDRIAFTTNKQSNIRARIATHSERLQRFLNNLHTGCLGRIENQAEIQAMCFEEIKIKLDALHEDVLAGKKGPSVITDMEGWIKQELVDDDITVTDVEVNQEQISAWLERLRLQDDMGAVLKDIVKREGAADASESSSPSMAGDARECQDQNLPEHIEGESLSPRRKTYEDSESSNAVYHAQQESDVQEQGISENFDFDLDMTGILISYHSNIETYVPDGHFRHVHTDSTCLGCPWNVPAMEKLLYQGEESILHFILAYKFMAATIKLPNECV
ncbi:hypothetical protein P280DRAFT_300321 [Massarina eburnea CBS 473.64]|uniref:Fungal N-terminal domain-containing protein n=1 Tax=Massarina eburnea CBS 473.64 TaxID=1395130 RepID=A0A6A6S4D9_9PLEO|nr:hypothetical protein P280DRAFT_300321 [Massarina eburnea CBS 473.64]